MKAKKVYEALEFERGGSSMDDVTGANKHQEERAAAEVEEYKDSVSRTVFDKIQKSLGEELLNDGFELKTEIFNKKGDIGRLVYTKIIPLEKISHINLDTNLITNPRLRIYININVNHNRLISDFDVDGGEWIHKYDYNIDEGDDHLFALYTSGSAYLTGDGNTGHWSEDYIIKVDYADSIAMGYDNDESRTDMSIEHLNDKMEVCVSDVGNILESFFNSIPNNKLKFIEALKKQSINLRSVAGRGAEPYAGEALEKAEKTEDLISKLEQEI